MIREFTSIMKTQRVAALIHLSFDKKILDRLREELGHAERLNNLRLYKMVTCLLSIGEGKKIPAIAKQLRICSRTVYHWFKRFTVRSFSWLLGGHYKGRGPKPRLTEQQRQKLYERIVAGPESCGYDRAIWNAAMIVIEIEKLFGVTYSPRYVSTILKKMGLTYQKAKFVPGKIEDQEWQQQRQEWEEQVWPAILTKAEDEGADIFFGDEVSFAQWGSLGRTWAPKGKQPTVKTSGKRKGLKLFGVIALASGNFIYQECDGKFNGQSYMEFLDYVLKQNGSRPVILIEDGAPYHRGADVKQYKADQEKQHRLFTYRLPSYSPDKNPIEKLWKNTKADATHCKYFPNFDDLRNAVITAFNKYLNDAAQVICVMKKLRLEAGVA